LTLVKKQKRAKKKANNISTLIIWASRFAGFARSRRAIRSISHFSPAGFRGWFRYYPSRKKHPKIVIKIKENGLQNNQI
jgi:hypothetical protein